MSRRTVAAGILVSLALLWPAQVLAQANPTVVVEYYHLDALGSVRAVTNQQGQVIARHDFLPFGEEFQPPVPPVPPVDTRLFTGKERDAETGQDYSGARYYRADLGRLTTVDPITVSAARLADPQQLNLYAYAKNNPLRFVDPDGRSTHTNRYGDVVAVLNDGDLGVYRHAFDRWDGNLASLTTTGPGVWHMGYTWVWDEFRRRNPDGSSPRILFGESWDGMIASSLERTETMSLANLVGNLRGGQSLDIKSNLDITGFGALTGRMLFGKYATAESAGNYLAGALFRNRLFLFPDKNEMVLRAFGGYHASENSIWGAARGFFGIGSRPAPDYGEVPWAAQYQRWGLTGIMIK